MVERLGNNSKNEVNYSVGDVVLVLRDVTQMKGKEEAGIIYDIEKSGRVFINYGGVVSLLHEEEKMRPAPEDIKKALELRLKQNDEDLRIEMSRITRPIAEALEEYYLNDTPFKSIKISVKSFFDRFKHRE